MLSVGGQAQKSEEVGRLMFSLKLALVRSLVEYLQQFLIPVIRKKILGGKSYQR